MIDALANAIIVTALLLAGWSLITTLRDRPAGMSHLVGVAVVVLALLAQEAIAIQRMIGGERPEQLATFIGYLVASLLVLPLGAWLGMLERTRWGSAILGCAFLVVPVLVVRLQQLWTGTSG